ncbi:M20 metallopeptidase family protein [Croceicoccus naphthovorans]|uniref:Amidohydrolase n=1 Tax=Croceicoccus naphthovorans TaxID=1348774 RepID=A0A0G3XEY1_9SPHN|nr:M20 family metallopeptidase [Croceicoccus naphthovorans]AKM08948.1 amidohydrolase [Croceicoccus naphthovorans]MBB3989263.1 hippurate hydrolase [Croceicoccus naphthovorans]
MNQHSNDGLTAAAEALGPQITALRRAIHADPELGIETPRTMAKVREMLADLPLEWREGTSTTGQVAVLKGGAGEGRRVLLRGDMDALPMGEETGLDFASEVPGRMHACGHDSHTAMLAGAVRLLAERVDTLAGEIYFMFQPGEEGFGGARMMIEDGLLDPKPDAAFAYHIIPNAPHGLFVCREGALMAASDAIEITVTGRGGHASMPHACADPLPVAAEIVTALQATVTRRFDAADPVVVTITQFRASDADNIIPERCILRGTIRTLSETTRERVHAACRQVVEGIASAHGMAGTFTVEQGFPVTLNDARAVALARNVVTDRFGAEAWYDLPDPLMTAEDFSYVLQAMPGAMVLLGVAKPDADWQKAPGLHSPHMHIDESVLPRGSAALAAFAMATLERGLPETA